MSGPKDWPDGWSRDPGDRGRGSSDADATRVIPPSQAGIPDSRPRRRPTGAQAPPPPPTAPRRGDHPPPPFARPRRRARPGRWLRRVPLVLLLVVALLLGMFLYFYSRIEKVDAVQDYEGRPEDGSGQNWLIVGSDSREGLSDQEIKDLRLGKAEGRRTDTIILLHRPASGKPTLVSLPRDSYVPIPGQGRNKLNAAYALGGPDLLVQTVEQVSGLRIDHYSEVGFGGFVGMTDAVGGVELCPARNIRDRKAGCG